jgi:transcriptional regulator with XRE-family HTH domain
MEWIEIDPLSAAPGGKLIEQARKRAVISQSELGRRMGVQQQAISRWERGVADPPFRTVLQALGACGWDLFGSLAPRGEGREFIKDPPPITPATFMLSPQDGKDSIDSHTANLRRLKDSQRAWRREVKNDPFA